MKILSLLILFVTFEISFQYFLEVKPIPENMVDNQTFPKSSFIADIIDILKRKQFLNRIASQIKRFHPVLDRNKELDPFSTTNNEEDDDTHVEKNIEQDETTSFYPFTNLFTPWHKYGLKLMKKGNGKLDDSVPFWAARG